MCVCVGGEEVHTYLLEEEVGALAFRQKSLTLITAVQVRYRVTAVGVACRFDYMYRHTDAPENSQR